MSKTIVKYHNDLNSLPMRNWSSEEMDLFFTLIMTIRDEGTELLRIDGETLKEFTGTNTRNSYWYKMVDDFCSKSIALKYREEADGKVIYRSLFDVISFDAEERYVEIEVSKNFEYIVNKLAKSFTVWELKEFTKLRSTYSKTMYRILKQWRILGKKEFSIDQFRDVLDIPKSYTANNINQRVLQPIQKELPVYFKNFKTKVLKKNTQGNPVIGYLFTWQPEEIGKWIPNKYKKEKKHSLEKDDISIYLEKKLLEDLKASQKALREDQICIDDI